MALENIWPRDLAKSDGAQAIRMQSPWSWPHYAVLCLVAQSCLTFCDHMDCSPPGSSVHGDTPGKNTGMACHALLQEIFPTQGWNTGILHCRWILYHLSHQVSPRLLDWVAYPFSRGSSQPRNWTGVSCIAGRFFTSWATRKAPCICRRGNNNSDNNE